MTRPAYLDGVVTPLVVRRDGPSLVVESESAAPVRLPFGRLARLVVRGRVAFDAEAIAALLRHGIAAVFLSGDGRALGGMVPSVARATDLAMLLDAACELHDWNDHRQAWLAAQERRAVLDLCLRLAIARPDLRAWVVRRRVLAWVEARLPEARPLAGAQLVERLEALLMAEIMGLLPAYGLGPRFSDPRAPDQDVAAMLFAVLRIGLLPMALELAAYLRDHSAKHREERALMRRIARRFEVGRAGRERATAGLLASLQRRLLELVP
jgi:hypothetical protein